MGMREIGIVVGDRDQIKLYQKRRKVQDLPANMLFLNDFSQLSELLSRRRIELLRTIKRHPNYNVTHLAKLLGRKQEAVSRDIGVLRLSGIIDYSRGKEVVPSLHAHAEVMTIKVVI